MIAVKDLGRAQEFYGARLGLKATDERAGAAVRYETNAGTWFLVYQSQFGTAKSTCMRFEVDDIELAVQQLRDRGIARGDGSGHRADTCADMTGSRGIDCPGGGVCVG